MKQYNFRTALGRFRSVAVLEGISYLLLLGVAMPLKYMAGQPNAVLYTGWIHGLLFVLYCFFLLEVWIKHKWSFGKVLIAFLASLLPFGTFVFDARLKKEAISE